MHWMSLVMKLLIPLGMAIYTVNFGRWLGKRKHKMGAFGAYLIGVLSMGMAAFVLIRNSI
ncbi:MAG: hypothetical protein ACXVP5_11065 [Tumebacillaceae bacterium]